MGHRGENETSCGGERSNHFCGYQNLHQQQVTTNPASKIAERETKAVMLGANPGRTLYFNNMETFLIILICAVSVWLLIRNFKVYKFQIYLIEEGYNVCNKYLNSVKCFDENEFKFLRSMWDSIADLPYGKMLFSFKPLKPEYWLNEKQLDFLRINKS